MFALCFFEAKFYHPAKLINSRDDFERVEKWEEWNDFEQGYWLYEWVQGFSFLVLLVKGDKFVKSFSFKFLYFFR